MAASASASAHPTVATVLIPGTEDPASVLKRGGLEVTWKDIKTKSFKEAPCQHIADDDMSLPQLFLHFLDERFKVGLGEVDPALRAGNDNAEVQLVLPELYTGSGPPRDGWTTELQDAIDIVLKFLKTEATVPVSAVTTRPNGSDPKMNYMVSANPGRWYFSIKTSRPKADINVSKDQFDIPDASEIYLFAENHSSVTFMEEEKEEAFEVCLNELMEESEDWQKFAVFVKIFYEGGFAYNAKEKLPSGAYLPRTTGLAALGMTAQREAQAGISTTHPYLVKSQFLNFSESVPVTIKGIRSMSDRHSRYGLCFTRCVYLWEDDDFDGVEKKTLCFCSLLPHGGFFYVPSSLEEFNKQGGLVYAFGEKAASLGAALASDQS